MKNIGRLLSYLFLMALVAIPIILYFNAQALSDWWALRGYTPPQSVVQLASRDTMTAYARHAFYVNHPVLESSPNQFRSDCQETEKTIILGCYHGAQKGIFIYNVQDKRLAGVQEVTSAHEMLHAVYDRLSSKDRNYVDGLLQDYYNHGLHDQRIIQTIHEYRQSEPNDVVNEMHSVFGTEIADLPAPLEAYYRKYFTNRQAVTVFEASYETEFTSREAKIKADDARLSQMKTQIDNEEQSLQQQLAQITADRARLGSIRDPQAYNNAAASFNAEVSSYNAAVDSLRADIVAYNQLVEERNSIASELTSLDKSIDTRLTTQQPQ